MPTVDEMRMFLLGLYGQKWKERVKKMRDGQVIATYKRIQTQERERKNK